MTTNNPITRWAILGGAAVGLWSALVLLFGVPLSLTGPVSWREGVSFGVSFWMLWLAFLPSIGWLALRFPFGRKALVHTLALHMSACLLVVVANRVGSGKVEELLPRRNPRPAAGSPGSPGRPALAPGPPGALGVFRGLRAAIDVLVYWSLVGACQAFTNFRRSEERERRAVELEARLAQARLEALRMQINPHFLFNTLNSVSALVYANPRAADEMLGDLGDLLRRSLGSMEVQEVPLSEELDFLRSYIRIEQRRFGDRLQVTVRVPDGLQTALVPALVLQPLVENAIRHGIEPRPGPGLISIEARKDGRHLHLVVRDDGLGLPDPLPPRPADSPGIGLANTRARLRGLYGEDQSFSLGKSEPSGVRVEIRIPLRLEPLPGAPSRKPALLQTVA